MNYIKKLQRENEEMRHRLDAIMQEVQAFRAELLTHKFTGVDLDGGRKDWMSTSDIDSRLQDIHSYTLNGYPKPIDNPLFSDSERKEYIC